MMKSLKTLLKTSSSNNNFPAKIFTSTSHRLLVLATVCQLLLLVTFLPAVNPVVINEESDLPIKRINAGHSMQIGIPLEAALERIRSMPHRRNALIRSLGATALTQRAGRNLIFRVLLTIGHQNDLIECISQVMCEAVCNDEINKVAKNYFDTYPTDDYFVTYALGAIEKGREFGASYQCNACRVVYPGCKDDSWRQQIFTKYQYLLEVTNYVLDKIPS